MYASANLLPFEDAATYSDELGNASVMHIRQTDKQTAFSGRGGGSKEVNAVQTIEKVAHKMAKKAPQLSGQQSKQLAIQCFKQVNY
ncbi:hypothetical protein G5I_00851 [Acromyrmex echinatior]|uniref:Uncharacterized protein n=1 Tax=Acromyrmex echinatior TaxID=103372 RepID=F4W600_ACREC|nr:hypothetical protein G5I_00851 [Acromyrmex echinatior]